MRRHPTPPANPGNTHAAVDHTISAALHRHLRATRFRVGDQHDSLLMNDDDAEIEIAEAACRILRQTGGLVDRSDIARRHGLSRQRTYKMTNNHNFPRPVAEIGGRPVWLTLHVDRYRSQAQPGRPRQRPSDE